MNIFGNAKFGDKFRTRDGRMAIYNGRSINRYWLIVERHPWDIIDFNSWGRHSDSGLEEDIDIVSEWQEPINKEGLDRIDIINMLRGTTPSYSVMKDIPKELGSYCGGFVDEWKWNISAYNIEYYKEYSDEYLLELYYKCKKGERL